MSQQLYKKRNTATFYNSFLSSKIKISVYIFKQNYLLYLHKTNNLCYSQIDTKRFSIKCEIHLCKNVLALGNIKLSRKINFEERKKKKMHVTFLMKNWILWSKNIANSQKTFEEHWGFRKSVIKSSTRQMMEEEGKV